MAKKSRSDIEAVVEEDEPVLDDQDLDDADDLNEDSEEAALAGAPFADDDDDGLDTGMSMAGVSPGLSTLAEEGDIDTAGRKAKPERVSRFEGLALKLRRSSAQRCTIGIDISLRFEDAEPGTRAMLPDAEDEQDIAGEDLEDIAGDDIEMDAEADIDADLEGDEPEERA